MLKYPEIPPINISIVPRIQPFWARTYGSDKTPDPIATAQSAKILPLIEPYSIFPKVLYAYVLLVPWKGLKSTPLGGSL